LSLTIGDVQSLRVGDELSRKQSKNCKYRQATLNGVTCDAIQGWLDIHPNPRSEAPLFISRKTKEALIVPTLSQMVKAWCKEIGLIGNYGSHSLRKTWGYQQRVWKRADLTLLVRAFGHSSPAQTLEYLCILPQEIRDLYLSMEL
jgi:site-specific recombinase XerD